MLTFIVLPHRGFTSHGNSINNTEIDYFCMMLQELWSGLYQRSQISREKQKEAWTEISKIREYDKELRSKVSKLRRYVVKP